MNIWGWNSIKCTLSIRTYNNTIFILLPAILLSLLSLTIVRTFQSLSILISRYAQIALTRLEGITLAGLIMFSAIFFTVALFISTKNSFRLCPSFNLKSFATQQLYEMWPYMGSFSICLCVYKRKYSSSNTSRSKVHIIIDVRMYCSVRPPFLLMNFLSFSQCLTSE